MTTTLFLLDLSSIINKDVLFGCWEGAQLKENTFQFLCNVKNIFLQIFRLQLLCCEETGVFAVTEIKCIIIEGYMFRCFLLTQPGCHQSSPKWCLMYHCWLSFFCKEIFLVKTNVVIWRMCCGDYQKFAILSNKTHNEELIKWQNMWNIIMPLMEPFMYIYIYCLATGHQ